MKKNIILIGFMFVMVSLSAQNRRYLSSFQFYPSYYNPAMTGFSGNNVSVAYRISRWVGFEGAPQTYFMSGDFKVKRHAFGMAFLHDSFGPYRESDARINYGIHINLSRNLQLRAGAAATLNLQRLDMSAIEMNNQNDPAFQNFQTDFNTNMAVDVNIGIALTGTNFYIGYALQNVTHGKLIDKGDYFNRLGYFHHVAQLGFRKTISPRLGMIVTTLYRYDQTFFHTAELQLKTVILNKAWMGLGYRSDLTPVALIGIKAKQFQIGLAYELSTRGSSQANSGTSELVLNYKFKTPKNKMIKHVKKPKTNAPTLW